MKRKNLCYLLAVLLLVSLSGCDLPFGRPAAVETAAPAAETTAPEEPSGVEITLKGDSISARGKGVNVSGRVVTITKPGEYVLRGTLNDGRVVVNTAGQAGDVVLTLDGAEISCLTDSAIYVAQADEVDLVLAAGSCNVVVSGTEADAAAHSEQSNGAAIFAEDDLDIKGEGSLEITGYINNGVTCKDDLCIKGGQITVAATNNGLRASESVRVSGGTVTVTAGKDGLKATSAAKEGKGFVEISGGSVTVICAGDGVSAETALTVSDGSLNVTTTGGDAITSSKGLKARTELTVSGGELTISSFDHCLRSGGALTVSGGSITGVSADGKGLSAEGALLIADGALDLTAASDGVFSEVSVTVRGGTLAVSAGKDGLKAGSKVTGFETPVGDVLVEGGEIRVTAGEDPVDGKASQRVDGGAILAIGTSKALKPFGADGAQRSLAWSFSGAKQNTVTVSVDGAELMSVVAGYGYNTVLCSAPELQPGSTCTVGNGLNSAKQTLD